MRRVGKFLVSIVFLSVLCISAKGVLAVEYQCDSCSSCNNAIASAASSDTVKLNTSINNYAGGTCISFNGKDDITFDCMGNTIDGDDAQNDYGIWLNDSNGGSNNNTVTNCTVRDFSTGLYISTSAYNNLTSITITDNQGMGLGIWQSSNNTITNLNITENAAYDVSVTGWSFDHCKNLFTNVTTSGIYPFMYYNYSFTLSDTIVSELVMCQADNSSVNNVTVIGSQTRRNNGIIAERVDYSNFTNINSSNGYRGLFILAGSNNIFRNITTSSNAQDGIYFSSSYNNTVENLTLENNYAGIGLYMMSQNNTIKGARITNSSLGGVILASSGTNYPLYNILYNSFFNNTVNLYSNNESNFNYWNTTRQNGNRIYSAGNEIGGNFWAYPNGTGYSQTCVDMNTDGFCEVEYAASGNNIDYLPLSNNYSAPAWANSSFNRCKNITISNSASSSLVNFPAYINLTYDSDMLPDFRDIRFYGSYCGGGGISLDYEIENYTLSNRAHVWVRIPFLPAAGTTISVYYKNDTAISSGENPTGVWDSNYIAVYHMNRLNATDSTSNQLTCNATSGAVIAVNISGEVDGALEFDASMNTDSLNCSNLSIFNPENITLEAWINMRTSSGYYGTVIAKYGQYEIFQASAEGYPRLRYCDANGCAYYSISDVQNIANNTWHYIATTHNTTQIVTYLNGKLNSSVTDGPPGALNTTTNPLSLGGDASAGYVEFNGTIDEIRISSQSRSADWINQTYQMMANQASFVSFGSEQTISFQSINNCSVLNNASTTYNLAQDITDSSNTTCFNVTADNVVLDCNYHIVDGLDTPGTNGIYVKGKSNFTVRNCIVKGWGYGIYLDTFAFNAAVHGNNVTSNTDGIEVVSSWYNNISSNIIENQNDGIYLSNASYNRIENNEIKSSEMGISLYSTSRNNTASGNVIKSTTTNALYVYQSYDNLFRDIYVNSTANNIYHFASSDTVFLNVTIDKSKVTVDAGAVYMKWYADIVVLSTEGVPVQDANVSGRDKDNVSAFATAVTNATGHIERQNLTEFHQNFTGRFYYSNYTINSSAFAHFANQTYANMTSNRQIIVRLYGISPPSVDLRTYTKALAETDMFKPGRILRIRAYVDYNFGREYIRNATIIIRDDEGSNVVTDQPMTNVANTTNGYIYEYNYTIPGDAEGLWPINVTSSDSFGRKGFGSKKIAVLPLTLQVKLVINSTSDNVYVPGTGETNFAGLATNEYASPSHYYIASSSAEILKSLVFAQMDPISVFTEKGTSDYAIGASQRYSNSMVFVVFSKGRWTAINNRISAVENKEFLTYPEPSFGFGLGTAYRLKTIIENSRIDLNKTLVLPRGFSSLIIEKKGSSAGKASIEIRRG